VIYSRIIETDRTFDNQAIGSVSGISGCIPGISSRSLFRFFVGRLFKVKL
jgi:hypothetical protein